MYAGRLAAVLLFFLPFTVAAQTVQVHVADNNGNAIGFAYIHILSRGSEKLTVQADEDGNAVISPASYPCVLEASAMGYEQAKKNLEALPEQDITLYLLKKFSTLNEVVITGQNAPVKQKDALSIYKLITKEQIQAQGAITLDEVMKNQLNVRVSNDNILGSSLQMQGLSGNKVKILLDGIPLNGREGGNINLSQVNMQNVDRIEVVQGPMSVSYGADAIGGVINIITKTDKKPFGLVAGAYYESIGKSNLDLSVTKRLFKRHQLSLGGSRNYFPGFREITQLKTYNDDTLLYSRGFLFKPKDQYTGNFSYSYTAAKGFNVLFASDYVDEVVTNKDTLKTWDPFNGAKANEEYFNTVRSMNRLTLGGKSGKAGSWQMQNGFMLYHRVRSNYVRDLVNMTREINGTPGLQDTSLFNDVYARGSYSNILDRLAYTAGYDINLQYANSMKIPGRHKEIQDYAAYTNLTYDLWKDKLKVQGGLRASHNSVYNAPLIPSASVLYTPILKVQVRASYAKGYRAPSLKEMYLSFIDINHYVIGNPALLPEHSDHGQVSASYQVFEKENDYLQVQLTGYYNDVTNGIALAPMEPDNPNSLKYTYANLLRQKNIIISLQADGQYSNLHYQLGYSTNYTYAQQGYYAAFLATEATTTLQYALKKVGMNLNVFYKLSGSQPFLQANIDGSASYNGTQKAFHLCDISADKRLLNKRLQLMAGVKNVFNFQMATVSGRVSSGTHGGGVASFLPRSVFASVRYSIN